MSTKPSIPQHDEEAERLVLAAYMLRSVDVQDEIESFVTPEDFYVQRHAEIFAALVGLKSRGAPTNSVALQNELTKLGRLAGVGGSEAVLSITDRVPSPKTVETLCQTVSALSAVRRMQGITGALYADGYSVGAHDANAYLDEAAAKVQAASERRVQAETSAKLGTVAQTVLDRAFEAFNSGRKLTGTSTGFDILDRMTTGFNGGEMWVVGGRASQGKSAAGQALALKIAMQDLPVLIISLEMPKSQWAERALSSIASVPLERIRTASFHDADAGKLRAAEMVLNRLPLDVDDGRSTVIDIRIKARKMKRRYGKLGAVVVDYLQLVRTIGKQDSREQAVAEISRSLKALAMELDIPVIALAQVGRSAEKGRSDKRPMLSDLRESGAIEQDADVVMFVYRDEVYNKAPEVRGLGEFIISKQRNGPIGTVHVQYVNECCRFQNKPWDE